MSALLMAAPVSTATTTSALDTVEKGVGGTVAIPPLNAETSLAAQRFNLLMNPVAAPAEVASVVPLSAPVSSGSTIGGVFSVMNEWSADYKEKVHELTAAINNSGTFTPSSYLKAQLEIVEFSTNVEYAGKLVSQVPRSIDQLVKLQ